MPETSFRLIETDAGTSYDVVIADSPNPENATSRTVVDATIIFFCILARLHLLCLSTRSGLARNRFRRVGEVNDEFRPP